MKKLKFSFHFPAAAAALALALLGGCSAGTAKPKAESGPLTIPDESSPPANAEVATFAAGCFWCVEEVFHQLDGVSAAISGYMGGTAADAKYDRVARGLTDHAESVQVTFDSGKVSYKEVLDLFWKLHDPTQVDGQGPDHGRQYRSAIFYHSEAQKTAAMASKKALEASGKHPRPIATEIVPAKEFYEAEKYHQNYARLNPRDRYIRAQLVPKLKKLGLQVPE